MSGKGIKVVFGGAMVNKGRAFEDEHALEELFAVLKKEGVKNIDTAQLYGDSEEILGKAGAPKEFIIDTKAKGGFAPGSPTKENIIKDAKESMRKLGTDKVSKSHTASCSCFGAASRTKCSPSPSGRYFLHPRSRLKCPTLRNTCRYQRSLQSRALRPLRSVKLPSQRRRGRL